MNSAKTISDFFSFKSNFYFSLSHSHSFIAFSFVAILFFLPISRATAEEYYTWKYTDSRSWHIETNWYPEGEPTGTDYATINNGGTAVVDTETANCYSLSLIYGKVEESVDFNADNNINISGRR